MKKILYKTILVLLCISTITGPAFAAAVVPSSSVSNPVTTPDPLPAPSVKSALSEFKSLSRSERKLRLKEVKKELKEYKKQQKSGAEPSTNTLLLVILAILLPPLAVYLHEGEINNKFWLSLLLTLLFWIPGVIYALLVVLGEV
jgi:uncharacterized membrane protein YqaE (UPF0057 family)